jgi:MoaA/NifB/PqqE/SkfB family radical SAM enzyme
MTDSRVDVCVVLSKYNVHDVCDIVNLARGKGVRTLFITLMILRGRGIFENLPSLEAARASIRDLLEEFSGIGEDLLFNNVPLCFLGDCYKNSINYQSMKRKGAACELMFHTCNLNWSFIAEMALPTPLNYPECCAPCFFRDFCPAPSYISLFADPEKYVRPTQLLNTS